MTLRIFQIASLFVLIFSLQASGQTVGNTPEQEAARLKRLEWFNESRFGMFVHWGLYAIPGGEWPGIPREQTVGYGEWIMKKAKLSRSEYETLAKEFNPTDFDAEALVLIAKNSGMKYICITAKHHDGFAMFKSEADPFNIVDATPFKRDPMKELAEACAKHDIKLCFYYSQCKDWHHPHGYDNTWEVLVDKKDSWKYHNEKGLPQLRELLTHYGPIGMIWFDTPFPMNNDESMAYAKLVRELQPDCLINGRLGLDPFIGDYRTTRDGQAPDAPYSDAWESITVTVPATWGWRKDSRAAYPAKKLLHEVIVVASQGGNMLMNVGPDRYGKVLPASIDALSQVGNWLKVNGESLYGSSGNPSLALTSDVHCTHKKGALYFHILKWPNNGKIKATGLLNKVNSIASLADTENELTFTQEGKELTIHLPEGAKNQLATTLKVSYEGQLRVERARPYIEVDTNGSYHFLAKDAATFSNSQFRYDAFNECYADWSNARDGLVWEANFAHSGKFKVEVEMANDETANNGLSVYHLYIADQMINVDSRKDSDVKYDSAESELTVRKQENKTNTTRKSYHFGWMQIGTIEISKVRTGPQVVRIDPRSLQRNMPLIKSIRLIPVQ